MGVSKTTWKSTFNTHTWSLFIPEVVVLHGQVLPVHPHDHEYLWPPRRLRLVRPILDLLVRPLLQIPEVR